MSQELKRAEALKVLPQVETRGRVWNPDTLEWESITNETEIADPLARYKASDIDDSGVTQYYGFVDRDGNWYIMQVTTTTVRYFKGTSAYTTNWGNRATLVYGYFNTIF